jgi:hypothetical protein
MVCLSLIGVMRPLDKARAARSSWFVLLKLSFLWADCRLFESFRFYERVPHEATRKKPDKNPVFRFAAHASRETGTARRVQRQCFRAIRGARMAAARFCSISRRNALRIWK